VAQELGYADQSHMTRALKAIMGRTPGELAHATDGHAPRSTGAADTGALWVSRY